MSPADRNNEGPESVRRREAEAFAKGWTKNERGNMVPPAAPGLDLPLDQFREEYTRANPGWMEGIYSDPQLALDPALRDYTLAYAMARQQLGFDHEGAVEVARIAVGKGGRGEAVQPENIRNRRMAVLPLSSALQAQEVEQVLRSAPTPESPSGMRMALRYGLPTLGGLLALYGLAAMSGRGQAAEEERA